MSHVQPPAPQSLPELDFHVYFGMPLAEKRVFQSVGELTVLLLTCSCIWWVRREDSVTIPSFFGLSTWKNKISLYCYGEESGRNGVDGDWEISKFKESDMEVEVFRKPSAYMVKLKEKFLGRDMHLGVCGV